MHIDEKNVEELYNSSKNKKGYKGIYQLVIKRIIDIIFCLIILPVILLVTIPVAIAIKIEDGGPIFYKSRRLGKGFKEFNMLKFRSMRVNAPDLRNDDGSTFNSKNDNRVTRIGRFIRETSLDELPQCFNVMFGERGIIETTKNNADFSRVVTVNSISL